MADVERINSEFEGRTLTTLTCGGRPCWIAREIGRFLGYSRDGRRLAAKITGGWSDALLDGHDYTVLSGAELEAFRAALLVGDTGTKPSRAHRRLVLLYEPGLHLVLARTSKPVAHRLRRFLIGEVLPQLARTANANASASASANASAGGAGGAGASARGAGAGANANANASANDAGSAESGADRAEPGADRAEPAEPEEPGAGSAESVDLESGRSRTGVRPIHLHIRQRRIRILDVQLMREQRLMAQHDLRKRMFQAASLRTTVRALAQLGTIDDDQVHTYEVLATEIALGLDADDLMAELSPSKLFPPRTVTLEELIQRFHDADQQVDAPAGASGAAEDATPTTAAE